MNYFRATVACLFLFIILSVTPYLSQAQTTQTLFNGNVSHGGFGGPVVKIDDIAGSTGVWVGGRGGWILIMNQGHSISLGGGGYGLVTDHRVPNPPIDDSSLYVMNGYGGFEIEYTNQSHKLIHFTATTLIGGGGLTLRDRNYEEVDDELDSYFVFEPALQAEINITHFFRIAAGAGYRFTNGIDRFGFSDSDFTGVNGILTLKFGSFL